ncbi:MAG TPA: prepilin-type N-terminal cleavage/methylation domain-containing protein [Myxococcota bacterium]|nr:prepilin-type N-terminal cleavage/methylation domain-containing protein [Myxococcota bacterium]
MQKFRSHAGFTLLELMTVVAIIGFLTAIGISSMRSYSRHEETRKMASTLANAVSQARAEAMNNGRNTYLVFAEPTNGEVPFEANEIAAIFTRNDDGTIASIKPVFASGGSNPDVSRYGAHGDTVMKDTPLPPQDQSTAIPDGALSNLVDGSTIPVDPIFGVPLIAFSNRGSPTTIGDASFGSGAGAVYVTDNDQMVVAVVVEPFGEVHTLLYDGASNTWK